MASIQEHLDKIKNAIFGKDVRQAIHDSIKQCYDDAAVNHDNANMEVKLARGSHNTLNDRLVENEKNQEKISSQLDNNTNEINNLKDSYVMYLNGDIDDYTEVLNNIISSQNKKIKIIFPKEKIIKIGKVNTINKPLEIDFNFCKIICTTSDIMFNIELTGEQEQNYGRTYFKNYVFVKGEVNPIAYIKLNGEINATFDGVFSKAEATHSLIWHFCGYGNTILGEMRDIKAPRCIYLNQAQIDVNGWSYDFLIDVDISRNYTGLGIEYEGGTGIITGVVEGCELGGIWYNGLSITKAVKIDSLHCERNKLFDIKIGNENYDSSGATNQGNTTVSNCMLSLGAGDNYKSILYGATQWIILSGNLIDSIDKIKNIDTGSVITVIEGNKSPSTIASNDTISNINGSFRGTMYANNFISKNTTITDNKIKTTNSELIISIGNDTHNFKSDSLIPGGTTMTKSLGGRWNAYKSTYTKEVILFDANSVPWKIQVSTTGEITATKQS